jgi:hypothetical protein
MTKKIISIISLTVLSILLFSGGVWFGQETRMNGYPNWMMGNSGFMHGQYENGMDNSGFMNNQDGNGMGNSGFMNGQYGSMIGDHGMMNGSFGSHMTGFNGYNHTDPMTLEEMEAIDSPCLAHH